MRAGRGGQAREKGAQRPQEPNPGLLGVGAVPNATDERRGTPTRVLGLDLAMGTTGWCLLVGGQPEAHGSFDLPKSTRKGESTAAFLSRRAAELGQQVGLLVRCHRPEIVGYEYPDVPRPFWSGGSKGREFSAVQGLSRAEGFLIALWPHIGQGARLVSVPMTAAKTLVTGRPGANKDQVAYYLHVERRWNLKGWTPDEVDAAAVALVARETLERAVAGPGGSVGG